MRRDISRFASSILLPVHRTHFTFETSKKHPSCHLSRPASGEQGWLGGFVGRVDQDVSLDPLINGSIMKPLRRHTPTKYIYPRSPPLMRFLYTQLAERL